MTETEALYQALCLSAAYLSIELDQGTVLLHCQNIGLTEEEAIRVQAQVKRIKEDLEAKAGLLTRER